LVPLLGPLPQTNWTSTIGINFHPGSAGLPFSFSRQGQNSGSVAGAMGSQP
jgi:hypothetical protein